LYLGSAITKIYWA